jgi:glycosyltransferase involved in cell wall biosynthesis
MLTAFIARRCSLNPRFPDRYSSIVPLLSAADLPATTCAVLLSPRIARSGGCAADLAIPPEQNGTATPKGETTYSSVLVIVPAHNEQENIGHVVKEIKQNAPYADVLVINDGSSDATAEMAQRSGADVLNLPHNLGIGGAVQAGIKFAWGCGYPFVVRVDGDGQHNAADISRLLSVVMQGQADVAIGARFCKNKETYRPPFARRLGIRMFSLLVSILVGRRVYDPTSGLKCMNREAIKFFIRRYPQDYPEVEAHILMHKAGLKVVEIPVVMRPRQAGVSSIDALRSIYYMFKVSLATLIAALQIEP